MAKKNTESCSSCAKSMKLNMGSNNATPQYNYTKSANMKASSNVTMTGTGGRITRKSK